MDSKKLAFLKAVVGEQGTQALAKAAERSEPIEGVLVPRAIMAWIGVMGDKNYDGEIPGVENTYLDFAKNEDGLYDGTIAVGDDIYPFENANEFQLAASIAVALDSPQPTGPIEDISLARLGKSIDILAKAQMVSNIESELIKASGGGQRPPGPPHAPTPKQPPAAAAVPQKQPKGALKRKPVKPPMAPKPKAPPRSATKMPMPKAKSESFALSEANMIAKCEECGLSLIKNEKFVGCMCLRELASNVALNKHDDKYFISFKNLKEDEVSVILETLGV